jgi:hypothetical protein
MDVILRVAGNSQASDRDDRKIEEDYPFGGDVRTIELIVPFTVESGANSVE